MDNIIKAENFATNTMNIYALEGHKVVVTENTIGNGHEYEQDQIKELLVIGKEYTVDFTIVYSSSTEVCLKEFSHTYFNSVNFADVTEQSHEMDIRHDDWDTYNRRNRVSIKLDFYGNF